MIQIRKLTLYLAALASMSAMAQGLGEPTFKLSAGGPFGDYRKQVGSKMTLTVGGEMAYRLNASSSIVGTFGYQWTPGSNRLVSDYYSWRGQVAPTTGINILATGINPSRIETRDRKIDVQGIQLGAMWRQELADFGMYYQGGLRVGFNRTLVADTGTIVTTNGNAVTSSTDVDLLRVDAIAEQREKKSVSVGLVAGLGYRVGDRYNLELNISTLKGENPDLSANTMNAPAFKKSWTGIGVEVSYGIRF